MKLKNLPEGIYRYVSSTYISIMDGMGCTCDNCGRLIANMVTVESDTSKKYIIGQDCAKTLFSEDLNKKILSNIKAEKRRKEQAPILEAKEKRTKALNELLQASNAAGITNENINSDWAKITFNNLLIEAEKRTGIQGITYKR
jgi:hypothetical protein